MPDARHSTDLDALMRVIETLKQRIEHHGGAIGSNEIRTRTALVDPLLNALGWDTTDPAMVIPEYAAGGGVADYALLKVMPDENAPVIAFIEAKRLHEPLESHRAQMLTYANMSGVKYAGLTNGDRWELYEVFKEAPLHERRIVDVSLLHEPAIDCAVQLLPLKWPSPGAGNPFHGHNAEPLLLYACKTDASLWVIDMLIDWGANLGASDGYGWTLLHSAAAYCLNPEIMQALIDRGATIEAREYEGLTPLHCAASFNSNPEVVALLIDHGADIETKEHQARTPLYRAVMHNTPAIVKLLHDLGADINATDYQGWTPLHWAVLEATCATRRDILANWLTKIELLLRRGADPTATDHSGRTPRKLAEEENADEEILHLLPRR